MGRTRGIVLKVLVDCSWDQSRNTWKHENVVPVVFGNLGLENIASCGTNSKPKTKVTHPIGSQDSSIPVGHENVLPIHQAEANAMVSDSLLPLLELLQQLKVAGH